MLITGLRTLPSRRPYQGVQLFPSAAATGNEEWRGGGGQEGWGAHPGVVGVRWMDMKSVNGLSSQRVTVHARAAAAARQSKSFQPGAQRPRSLALKKTEWEKKKPTAAPP